MSDHAIESLSHRAAARVGTTIRRKYRVDRILGLGGMATVYAATHRNGNRVAIKVLHDRFSGDDRSFLREARLANTVGHPGVLNIQDDDVTEDGCLFLVMPLLEGETVRARWERNSRRLPVREVMVIAHALLDVLSAAHAKRIVHRDIKPENLFLTRGGELKVLDFGIARALEEESTVATR
jgi:serine/threonine protein kinase